MNQIDLEKMALQNRADELRAAIISGADPNERNRLGSPPLFVAIAYKSVDAVQVLLENGADVTIQDRDGSTALHYAIEHKLPKVLQALLLKCPEAVFIADKYGNQPLWTAAFHASGDYEMVKMLLDFGADPKHLNKVSLAPLDISKRRGEPALLQLMELKMERE